MTAPSSPNKKRKLNPSISSPRPSPSMSKPKSSPASIIPPLPQAIKSTLSENPLDGDAVRRHMLALMERDLSGSEEGSEDESGSESESESENESGSEHEKVGNSESRNDPDAEVPHEALSGSDQNFISRTGKSSESSRAEAEEGQMISRKLEKEEKADVKPLVEERSRLDIAPSRVQSRLPAALVDKKESLVQPTKAVASSPSPTTPTPSKPPPVQPFSSLPISPPLLSALHSLSLTHPTPIQSACFQPLLSGRDVIGLARTGSGKTIAFALPILHRLSLDPFGVFALVLTPTRELAYQLSEQFLALGRPLGLDTVTVVGGMDMMKQAGELKGRPHVVIATPGRLCDLLRSCSAGEWDLRRVKVLVLDEADRLLTPTFAPDLAYLFSQLPPDRQTCLFTATISPSIQALADRPPRPGKQPIFVHRIEGGEDGASLTVAGLRQNYLFIPGHVRDPYLVYLLREPPKEIAHLRRRVVKRDEEKETRPQKNGRKRKSQDQVDPEDETMVIPSTIIFTQRCATAHLLHLMLKELDIPSVPLHSHLTQPERLASLARFRAGSIPVLVTTDVGSRGLDIPEVAMVINWDCPRTGEDYVHRVGRTARAGRGGLAITIVTERDVELIKSIEELIKVKLTELELPEETVLEQLNVVATARRVANMAMHDSDFGERQATNKAKEIKRAKRDARARA